MRDYFAPGRINLIGEHIDYNGGKVLPAAISIGITASVTQRNDGFVFLSSDSHVKTLQQKLIGEMLYNKENDWLNYPLGVMNYLKEKDFQLPQLNIHYESTLPEGSGLSSSAAMEVLTMYLLLEEMKANISRPEIALWCKQVENKFIGVQCGIMDQFVIANAKQNHAMLLDCSTLEHEFIPIDFGEYDLVVLNTKKPRNLIHSKYNERKAECEAALNGINKKRNADSIQHLCAANIQQLEFIKDEVLKKRAHHVITENERVDEAVAALKSKNMIAFGKLLTESHQSLKHDYEVSGFELDTLVDAAIQTKGCIGARMTGAGFGGCAIALVEKTKAEFFEEKVLKQYKAKTGIEGEMHPCYVSEGVSLLPE